MIATASLNRPSPRMIEKSFGYSSNLTRVTAAMMSELQKMEEMYIACMASNLKIPVFCSGA